MGKKNKQRNSIIFLNNYIENQERKFGSWKWYYNAVIVFPDGKRLNALFTKSQIKDAIHRSNKNIEDLPDTKELLKEYLEK